ncbi:MAG TPA: hypothetical protein VF158_15620 [Longimicrobiales bacterium]
MQKTWRLSLPIVAGVLASVNPAPAQQIPSPYRYVDEGQSITVFGGYAITDPGKVDMGPESAPAGGIRYSIRLGGPFTAEASAQLLPTTRTVLDTTAVSQPLEPVGEADLSLALVDASLRFNVTGPRVYHGLMPFVLAGGGVVFPVSDDESVENAAEIGDAARFDFGTRFAGHVGAGIEWFATRRLALRADARDVFWKLPTPPAFQRQRLDLPEDEWVQNFVFSLGVAYHF